MQFLYKNKYYAWVRWSVGLGRPLVTGSLWADVCCTKGTDIRPPPKINKGIKVGYTKNLYM